MYLNYQVMLSESLGILKTGLLGVWFNKPMLKWLKNVFFFKNVFKLHAGTF